MLNFLISFLLSIVGLGLGFYLLLLGRKRMAVTTAIISLFGTSSLLALIFLGESAGWALTEELDWLLLGISAAAGIIGGILGARAENIAAKVVGFAAGGYMALWLYGIAFYVIVRVGQWSEQVAFWVGVAILIIGGLLGIYFTMRSKGVALILISVFIGTDIIIRALNLSPQNSFTAVIAISLALIGLVFQYAQFLRETKAERPHFVAGSSETPAPELFDLSKDHY
jgi:hypothetical protein